MPFRIGPLEIGIVAVIILIWMGIFLAVRNAAPKKDSKDPLTIAKTRYARGEITKAEFEQLKKDL